jgi:predicted nuclease with TOPRIM domain
MELSKEELCNKIESLKEKLRSIRKENSRLRQSLVMLQGKTSKGLAF